MAEEEGHFYEEDSAGYLMSVSDMMAGLLFVFILTLTAFIISFQAARDEAKTAVSDLTDAQMMRQQMLQQIQTTLKEKYQVQVQVDTKHGILRLTEKALSFPTGKANLPQDELEKLRAIASVLADVVPCYAANAPSDCEAAKEGELEAAFIEGHTDNVPIGNSRFADNLELSTARAAFTYRQLTGYQKELGSLINIQGQPVFSVSGYGANRPVNAHSEPTPDPANRRIDLRFIMAPPSVDSNQVVKELQNEGAK